ncbi:CDC45 family [Crassisporium funariophilum]|nr:CDC45 family [Crassisporium funariophilum]
MVYLPPPHLASDRPSYLDAYNSILTAHRRSPLSSASSVILLVAPNVDALCASRMLASLFMQDDVIYRIIPVSGLDELEHTREEVRLYTDLHTLIMINLGSYYDLPNPEWFGEFDPKVTVHVIDSSRPQSLVNLFMGGDNGERILVWDDGGAQKMSEEKTAWETVQYEPRPDSGDEDSDNDLDEEDEQDEDSAAEDGEEGEDINSETGTPSNKRRNKEGHTSRKRRRIDARQYQISSEDFDRHSQRIDKHYLSGTWHGQSAASTIYILATLLERVDNDFLWLAILGLTFQYTTSRISRDTYDTHHAIYYDEVSRLNPHPTNNDNGHPDDASVRATEELRFMLFRHWTLYDAMLHSSYVAGKLGIWKEKGRQKLTGLLAKMGFSIPQTQQPYAHMDLDLKRMLVKKLNDIAPEYGLVELSYPSFIRCYGFRSQPLSAADAVEGISALLDVAEGVRMEVEIEGTRNGGEWFGAGRVWEVDSSDKSAATRKADQETGNALNPQNGPDSAAKVNALGNDLLAETDGQNAQEPQWWVKNFWTAYDALTNITSLRKSLNLSMSLQRSIILQGTSIIDKQDIRTMRNHRVVVITQGPNLALFSHPGILTRLALWLVDALRDRIPATSVVARSKRKVLPVVVACLNEIKGRYTVVGVMAALEYGQFKKNAFALTFMEAQRKSHANLQFGSFDTSVMEIDQKDLNIFLQTLCE